MFFVRSYVPEKITINKYTNPTDSYQATATSNRLESDLKRKNNNFIEKNNVN